MCENELPTSCISKLSYYSLRMHAFIVTCGHFRSRTKDGGHTTRSAIVENIMLRANLVALCFIEAICFIVVLMQLRVLLL